MKKTMIVGALGALLCAAVGAYAQAPAATGGGLLPTAGTKEIGFGGNYSFNGDKPYSLSASVGYFTAPTIEFGAEGLVAGTSRGGSKTLTSIGGFADYYFTGLGGDPTTSALAPYIGAFIGYSHYVDNSTSYGGDLGVKYFFNPNVALNAAVQFRSAQHSTGQTNLVLGLSTFFR